MNNTMNNIAVVSVNYAGTNHFNKASDKRHNKGSIDFQTSLLPSDIPWEDAWDIIEQHITPQLFGETVALDGLREGDNGYSFSVKLYTAFEGKSWKCEVPITEQHLSENDW